MKIFKNSVCVLMKQDVVHILKHFEDGLFKMMNLKLVSAIFYQIFIFSPNDNPLKTMKNNALFFLEIFKFL